MGLLSMFGTAAASGGVYVQNIIKLVAAGYVASNTIGGTTNRWSCSVWVQRDQLLADNNNGYYMTASGTAAFGAQQNTRFRFQTSTNTHSTGPAVDESKLVLVQFTYQNAQPRLRIWYDRVEQTLSDDSSGLNFGTSLPLGILGISNGTSGFAATQMADMWQEPVFHNFGNATIANAFSTPDLEPVFLGENGELPFGTPPMYFNGSSMKAADWQAGENRGTGGNYATVIGTFTDLLPPYVQNVVHKDASTLSRLLAGIDANNVVFSVSIWMNRTEGTACRFLEGGPAGNATATPSFQVTAGGATFTTMRDVSDANRNVEYNGPGADPGGSAGDVYFHLLYSRNGTRQTCWVDNLEISAGQTVNLGTSSRITKAPLTIGGTDSAPTGAMDIGDLWFNTEFIDFDVEANRRLFSDSNLNPINLGTNGELPTGNQPLIFMGDTMKAADWNNGENRGTEADFDEIIGAYTDV